LSVNSNASALAVLQALDAATQNLTKTEGQVSSGLAVADAADNPAVYALAQSQRDQISSLSSVSDGLNRAQSIADVAVAAGQTISDLLSQLQTKALSATDAGQNAASLAAYNTDFTSLLSQIKDTIANASFGGVNLLNGSLTSGVSFMATADASSLITIGSQNMSLGGSLIGLTATTTISTPTAAASALTQVGAAITAVNAAVAQLGAQANQIEAHSSFVSTLSNTLTTGVGGLVDADVAAESARLTALQVQQQLGTQTLSIANQQPSLILTLLRGG
jgi:flagellin